MTPKEQANATKVWSRRENRWFPIIEMLDDDMYYARVWDDVIGDSFAITHEDVNFDILNESISKETGRP